MAEKRFKVPDYQSRMLIVKRIYVRFSSQVSFIKIYYDAKNMPHSCASLRPKSEIFFSDFTCETDHIYTKELLSAHITLLKVCPRSAQSNHVDLRFKLAGIGDYD